ncbi:bifunctional GNAT family N-acetyltransferase/acetate--CoA ligase family protein [Actinopolymorpha alba]|uniref:bifunctional acetate--CoA ligase family protein/GNAT family N-acetyltransferase n=1 Tax=Actinopolymorpha alba TaxID=533267 RepID=UPI0003667C33|nr:bifunctional GNAT family N-acetyltransferase/acetate--CoA ligase family protein [Actinopolymorpha alba]
MTSVAAAGAERTFIWTLLLDGTLVLIRPVDRHDEEAVATLHAEMSPDNQYLRFFGVSPHAPYGIAARICQRPPDQGAGLGAWLGDQLVGVAHYVRDPEDPTRAEVAFAVADDAHGRGVATLLLERLASQARAQGIGAFTAEVLARNAAMLRVFEDAGLPVVEHHEREVVVVDAELGLGEAYLDAVADRERVAQAASLAHILTPASVIVVGASERPGNVGGAVVRNLRAAGLPGPLGVVHPQAATVAGVRARPRVSDLPFVPDLAVIAVPVAALLDALLDCGRHGVRAVVVLTSGAGPVVGREMRDICHRYGMRMVGANSLGVANPAYGLDATFLAHPPSPGAAGVAVQSGGVGIALTEQLDRLGIGVSTLASLGEKYDVSATDLLHYWYADQGTRLALLYVESFGNPRRFARVARRLAGRIPVLAVDGGRSVPAQRAAASHTAAAATPTAARAALFADAGVVAVPDLGDLVATAALVGTQPLPAGGRIAVLSNAAGAAILAADACEDAGLRLPELTDSTRAELARLLPRGAVCGNPVDATAGCDRHTLAVATGVLAADPGIDGVLVLPVPTALDDLAQIAWPLRSTVPLVVVRVDQAERVRTEAGSVPAFAAPRDAALAFARSVSYATWRQRPAGTLPDLRGLAVVAARQRAQEFLAGHPEGGFLEPDDAAEFLTTAGIAPEPIRLVRSTAAAVEAASELEFPVAVKASGPALPHKQHAGGVVLDLADEGAVASAFAGLAARLGTAMTGAVVQRMRRGDVELLVGVSSDPVFGPVAAFGLSGSEADALADRVVSLAPLTDVTAARMVRGIRAARLLDQAAAGGPVDVAALEDLLLRLSVLADRVPELADLDLNPVLARADGLSLVDVKVRLAPSVAYDPSLRRLR